MLLPSSTPFPWPVTLARGDIAVRPARRGDRRAFEESVRCSAEHLAPWSPTDYRTGELRPMDFSEMLRSSTHRVRTGQAMPWVITHDDVFIGQINVNNIVWGAGRFASAGYWIDARFAGRGITTVALAMVLDHALTDGGLHRVEVCIRPENAASIAVVVKLGLRDEGLRERFLHIAGDWRDHRVFVADAEGHSPRFLDRIP